MSSRTRLKHVTNVIQKQILLLVEKIQKEKELERSEVFDVLKELNFSHPLVREYEFEIEELLTLTQIQMALTNGETPAKMYLLGLIWV